VFVPPPAPHEFADTLVREAELVDKGGERLGLDGVQVLAGDVLGEGDLEGEPRRPGAAQDRVEAGGRGTQRALAGDQP
jgi:hypothetical protein